jgi:hypothetical protein
MDLPELKLLFPFGRSSVVYGLTRSNLCESPRQSRGFTKWIIISVDKGESGVMAVFKSQADRSRLVEILKSINPTTVAAYGPALDAWLTLPTDLAALVAILRLINPQTVNVYGPMLDAWLTGPDRFVLVQILKLINPMLAPAYGPLLDAWASS